jgi:hypothetical protein
VPELARRAQDDLEEARHDGLAPEANDLIPRPRGSPGDARRGFVLIDALDLTDDPTRFASIRVRANRPL